LVSGSNETPEEDAPSFTQFPQDSILTHIIGPTSILYGLRELSKKKRSTLLQAEFPHFWEQIKKFEGGKTEYSERAMQNALGRGWASVIDDLVGIGLFEETRRGGQRTFKVPFVYREGLSLTQGRAD
jgi:hypothetical protein